MSRWSRATSPVALLLSVLALVVATSAGTAWAAVMIGTSNIKNGAVTGPKLHANAVNGAKIRGGSVAYTDLSTNARNALRVRAYATVSPNDPDGPGTDPVFVGARRGFAAVTRTSTGFYCLTLAPGTGIDTNSAASLVSPEFGYSAGDQFEAYSYLDQCPNGQISVYTEHLGAASNDAAFTVLVP